MDHVVRFACASDRKLKLTCGVLSVEHAVFGDAKSSKQYTLSALERFCRRDDGAPARGPASAGLAPCADAGGLAPRDPALDSECLARLRGQTQTLVADGAPAEQKSLRALRDEGNLPGVLLIARDKAHAARSVLTRPSDKFENWLRLFERFGLYEAVRSPHHPELDPAFAFVSAAGKSDGTGGGHHQH